MGYVACANCGNLNKDDATTCYSCGQEMVAAPMPPPAAPPPVEENPWVNKDVRVQPLSPSAGGDPTKARFKDLASRYEARAIPKTQANVVHGIRSGIPAGLMAGVATGFMRKSKPDELTRLLVRKYPKMNKHGSEIIGYSVCFDLFVGILLGLILGLTNLLCFPKEASTTGAVVGGMIGAGLVYMVGVSDFTGVILGAVNGGLIGLLASLIENKLFRGQ